MHSLRMIFTALALSCFLFTTTAWPQGWWGKTPQTNHHNPWKNNPWWKHKPWWNHHPWGKPPGGKPPWGNPPWGNPGWGWGTNIVKAEFDFLASIPDRRTGSPNHNELIDHIKQQLEHLGLEVQTETWHFDYNDAPLSPPSLTIAGKDVHVSSVVPYSGNTGSEGVTGPLISLISPDVVPDWSKASGGIAVVNLTNTPADRRITVPLWAGSVPWAPSYVQLPSGVANALVVNLTDAADAGVKGIVYVWENLSTGLAEGQYGPFWTDYQGIPALYASPETTKAVIAAAANHEEATLTLRGNLISDTPTRNIWVTFPGAERSNESVIINTHTDGVNIGEENGHIALLSYAASLVAYPPKRTTILAFITAHIHSAPFSYATHRSTTAWLADNPSLWNGTAPDHLTAVFGSCVEHLGMMGEEEDVEANTYRITETPSSEVLFAANSQLASLTFAEWVGAVPSVTRVINPLINGTLIQGGEGYPFLLDGIPEISLVTAPGWLLKQFPPGTDERPYIDYGAVERQIDSFQRIWRLVDVMDASELGTVPSTGGGAQSLVRNKRWMLAHERSKKKNKDQDMRNYD